MLWLKMLAVTLFGAVALFIFVLALMKMFDVLLEFSRPKTIYPSKIPRAHIRAKRRFKKMQK